MRLKKFLTLVFVFSLIFCFACEEEKEEGGGIFSFGMTGESVPEKWDLTISQLSGGTVCDYGFFNSLPGIDLPQMGFSGKFSAGYGLKINSSEYQLDAKVPEISLLLFATGYPLVPESQPVLAPGDQIEITYTRRLKLDGKGGDYFLVQAVNERNLEVVEEVRSSASGSKTVSKTFIANGIFFGLKFIFGLSSSNDQIWLDDFQVLINSQINGPQVFSEDFEGDGLVSPPNYIWLAGLPTTMLGSAGICSDSPISGSQSWCASGGRSYTLYGQGMEMDGMAGKEFNLTDGSPASFFLGAFMGMVQSSVLTGSYYGEDYNGTCQEQGAFFANINPSSTPDLGGTYQLQIQGELKNCQDPSQNGPILISIDSLTLQQFSSLFGGILHSPPPPSPPPIDSRGNEVQVRGLINGNNLMILLNTQAGTNTYQLTLSGIYTGFPLSGQVMGGFDACELEGGFSLAPIP